MTLWLWIKENPKASLLIAALVVCLILQVGKSHSDMAGGDFTSAQGVSTTAKTNTHLRVLVGATKDCPEVSVVHDCEEAITSHVTQTITAKCPTAPAFRLSVGASMPVYPITLVNQTELELEASYHKVNIRCGVNPALQFRAGASYQLFEY